MRKFIFLLALLVLFTGCTYIQKETKKLLIDSDYAEQEQRRAELEEAYINGEINYSKYKHFLDELEQDRLRSEQEREEILFR